MRKKHIGKVPFVSMGGWREHTALLICLFWSSAPPVQPQSRACSLPRGFVLLPVSVRAACAALQGLGQRLCRPVKWEAGPAPVRRQRWCEGCDVPPPSPALRSQDETPLSTVLASAVTPRGAWESPCPARILAWRLACVARTSEGRKGVACGCILLAQELQ